MYFPTPNDITESGCSASKAAEPLSRVLKQVKVGFIVNSSHVPDIQRNRNYVSNYPTVKTRQDIPAQQIKTVHNK